MSGAKRKKKYFPNRIKEWMALDTNDMESIDFEDIMEYRVHNWEISPEYAFIMREYIYDDAGKLIKVVSADYKQPRAAQKRIFESMSKGNRKFVVADHDSVSLLAPNFEDFDDE